MRETVQNFHGDLASSGNLSILVVTPEPGDVEPLRKILRDRDCTFRICSKLQEMDSYLITDRSSIVICDCTISDGSWIDVLAKTRGLPHPPPVVVASRHADERLWAEVLGRGGFDVVLKPFEEPQVVQTLRSALHVGSVGTPGRA